MNIDERNAYIHRSLWFFWALMTFSVFIIYVLLLEFLPTLTHTSGFNTTPHLLFGIITAVLIVTALMTPKVVKTEKIPGQNYLIKLFLIESVALLGFTVGYIAKDSAQSLPYLLLAFLFFVFDPPRKINFDLP